MSNKIEIFNHEQFGEVRTIYDDKRDEIWFVGKDIAESLGYKRPTKSIQDHVDIEDKDKIPIMDSIGRMQKTPIINESGMYSLILRSNLPSAREFKRWVTSEVLPSIRKHGGYILNQKEQSPEELLANAVLVAQKVIKEKEKELEEATKTIQIQEPKVNAWDKIVNNEGLVDVGDFAKAINIDGIGRNNMYKILREKEILMNKSTKPYQSYVDRGYFVVKLIDNTFSPTKTFLTPKGCEWLTSKLEEWGY